MFMFFLGIGSTETPEKIPNSDSPFENIDRENAVYKMHNKFGYDFSRCVHFFKRPEKRALRYCQNKCYTCTKPPPVSECFKIPNSWQHKINKVWFDGLVTHIDLFSDDNCEDKISDCSNWSPYSNITTEFKTFKIVDGPETRFYIGRSIFDYSFRSEPSDFPSLLSLINREVKVIEQVEDSTFVKMAAAIPYLDKLAALMPVIEDVLVRKSTFDEKDWRHYLVNHIPDVAEQSTVRTAIHLIEAKMETVKQNIRFLASPEFNLTRDTINHNLNDDLYEVVNFLLLSDALKKYSVYCLKPLFVLTEIVKVYYPVATPEIRNQTELFKRTRQLVNDYHHSSMVGRLNLITVHRITYHSSMGKILRDAINKVTQTTYGLDYFGPSYRIQCLDPSDGQGIQECLDDPLNAESPICAQAEQNRRCFEDYTAYVKYRFEQSYQQLLDNLVYKN